MTDYEVTDIIKRVRNVIDMNMVDTALANDMQMDTLSLDDIIRESIVPAAQLMELNAPIEMLGEGVDAPRTCTVLTEESITSSDTYKVCHGLAPTDFMRLVAFRMSDWLRSVNVPIAMFSPQYAIQRSRVQAVRGCPERPVLAIGVTSATADVSPRFSWEAYSSKAGAAVDTFSYIPQPSIDKGKISLCPLLVNAIVYATAYLTAVACGDVNKASIFLSTAKTLAGVEASQTLQQPQEQ